jgi:hypothetical protein
VSLGPVISTHDTMASAFAANDEFQKNNKAFVRVRIVTLKSHLQAGQHVRPGDLAEFGF